jgi:hypothetical protein
MRMKSIAQYRATMLLLCATFAGASWIAYSQPLAADPIANGGAASTPGTGAHGASASRGAARNSRGNAPEHLVSGDANGRTGVPPRGERRFVSGEIILGFRPSTTQQSIDRLARRYRVTRLGSQDFPLIGIKLYRWRVNGRSVVDAIGAIENERLIATAQPNYVFTLQEEAGSQGSAVHGDTAQYVLDKLQIEQAHRVATGKNVAIAIIDSEVDTRHPDLAGTIAERFDALGGDETPHQHGTAIAGAIAAHGKISGIASAPRLLAARAFDGAPGETKGTSFAIYKSLQWAADNGARVIDMSFAGPSDALLHRLLAAVHDKGIVLIAAAGNAGPHSAPLYPAADPNVIAVTATDSNDALFGMANRGPYIAIAAPGVDVLALAPADAYQLTTGTSVAAAHVSGIAALLLEEKPSLGPADVREILIETATPLGSSGAKSDFGAGLANAYRAVTFAGDNPAGKKSGTQAQQ